MRKKVLITGSSGLVGSEAVLFFDQRGWDVCGVDNNMRRDFFGPDGDTSANLESVRRIAKRFSHFDLDIRNRSAMLDLMEKHRPHLILHSASQPSHDLAKDRPFDDFEVNAVGTLNVLEGVRRFCPESSFVFMSTNKVYGDAPNEIPLSELKTRYDYADPKYKDGIDESCRIDMSLHSLFGASKLAADVMVQEYGRNFGIPTVCFRCGCLTGSRHAGAEAHGFLAYVVRAIREGRTYRIYGYKGKQVRDNLHAYDVCTAVLAFSENPKVAAVYNLGGGRGNSVSVIEAIDRFEELMGRKLKTEYVEEPRRGDHICYVSNLSKFKRDYPSWRVSRSLEDIFTEFVRPASIIA
ncbi:MAG: NAD-dependent epimerase/dehydratase family protein [Candidatus Omnitrophica bacterium]|nr:NAD-dependent epimerase/dehydratase family protein [Candidatus Omnitrophota bacterium]